MISLLCLQFDTISYLHKCNAHPRPPSFSIDTYTHKLVGALEPVPFWRLSENCISGKAEKGIILNKWYQDDQLTGKN